MEQKSNKKHTRRRLIRICTAKVIPKLNQKKSKKIKKPVPEKKCLKKIGGIGKKAKKQKKQEFKRQ